MITLSGIILTSGLSGSTISSQASVKQQVFNSINSKSNVEIVRDKMNRINLVSAGDLAITFIFLVITWVDGNTYTAVARVGGMVWVFILSMIVFMPIVIPVVKKRIMG